MPRDSSISAGRDRQQVAPHSADSAPAFRVSHSRNFLCLRSPRGGQSSTRCRIRPSVQQCITPVTGRRVRAFPRPTTNRMAIGMPPPRTCCELIPGKPLHAHLSRAVPEKSSAVHKTLRGGFRVIHGWHGPDRRIREQSAGENKDQNLLQENKKWRWDGICGQ